MSTVVMGLLTLGNYSNGIFDTKVKSSFSLDLEHRAPEEAKWSVNMEVGFTSLLFAIILAASP